MTQQTLDLIHRTYQKALEISTNHLEVSEKLYQLLYSENVVEEDCKLFDTFLDALRACIHYRKKTFEITNLATYLNITMMYIVLWLNTTKNMKIDINWYARRKSLESDLTKLLRKSNSEISVNIRDRFGIRGILLNNISDVEAEENIYSIYEAIMGIIAAKSRKIRQEFYDWITESKKISEPDKTVVKYVLNIPFAIDYVKDYIKNPKPNNYRSLQFTITIPVYSNVLPGCQIEIQLRSKKMHEVANNGTASHPAISKIQSKMMKLLEMYL